MNLSVSYLCNIAKLFLLNINVAYLRAINLCTCPTLTAFLYIRLGSNLLIPFVIKFIC